MNLWHKLKQLIKHMKTPEEIEREEYFSGKTKCALCKTPTPYRVKHKFHTTTAILCGGCHRQMHIDKIRADLDAEHARFLERENCKTL